jgi:RNA polymerase sigma-70 factor (ECF subfamily)
VNDYLQAAWLKVLEWLSAGKYKEQGKFKAWFVNIVYGVAFDALRKREKLPVNKAAIEELEQLAGIDIDRKINKFETDQYFAENLNKVPEEFRDAVVLSVKEEMSAEEIAQCLKIKVGTACSRTNRGLNYLQKFYTAPKRAAMGRIYRKRKKITGSGIDRASAAFIVIERHEMENS